MKSDIHPEYRPVVFLDTSSGEKTLTRSTIATQETIEWEDGNTYPLAKVEISSASHPFFTGQMTIVDTAGRVERFERRYGKRRRPTPIAPIAGEEGEGGEGGEAGEPGEGGDGGDVDADAAATAPEAVTAEAEAAAPDTAEAAAAEAPAEEPTAPEPSDTESSDTESSDPAATTDAAETEAASSEEPASEATSQDAAESQDS